MGDFRVAEAAGRGAHIRARRGPVYGVSWRGRRLGGRRWCPSGGLCPARMFPGLAAAAAAHRCSWAALCRLGGGRAATRGRSQGWKNVMTFESFTYVVPDIHPHLSIINQVKLYSTNVQKGGQGSQTPKADKVPSLTQTVENIGAELKAPLKQDPLQVRVKAVLKKRDYGSKYTKNNFITGVRAINEFCLKSSDLEQLRKIRRRSPHDDTESFTVFLRSDVEAKALEVWGSLEALAREKKLRKEAEIEYRERLFRNQRILREYGDFLGNTKVAFDTGVPLTQFSTGPS